MIKNAFDYLESSFNKIFCFKGYMILKSSFIVWLISSLFSLLLWSLLLVIVYNTIDGLYNSPANSDIINVIQQLSYVFLITISILALWISESAYYAIVLSKKFNNYSEQQNTDLITDSKEWTTYFKTYFLFVTYYSLVLLWTIFLLWIGCILLYLTLWGWLFLWGLISMWVYLYVVYRLSISWYTMLFWVWNSWDLFWDWWKLLWGKVFKTFKKIIFFTFIVWTAGSIATYLAQLILPNFTSIIIEFSDKMKWLKESDLTLDDSVVILRDIFQTVLFPGVYSIIVFSFFYKVSAILQRAMSHSFLVEYFNDVKWENSPSSEG